MPREIYSLITLQWRSLRSKEWFLKIDQSRSSRLSKRSRRASSSNHSTSLYKYSRHFSSDDQQSSDQKRRSPLYHDVTSKKSTRTPSSSSSSSSSSEISENQTSFPPPPPSVTKDLIRTDQTSVYSITDDQREEISIYGNELSKPFHPDISLLPSTKEKFKDDEMTKLSERRLQSSASKTILKHSSASNVQPKESIRKSNIFTSSSHSMVDAGCGGHLFSKIPALRCLRPSKQHQTQRFQKTSPLPPPPLVVR